MYDIENPTGKIKKIAQNEAISTDKRLIRATMETSYDSNGNEMKSYILKGEWLPITPDGWGEKKLDCITKIQSGSEDKPSL